MPSEDAVCNAVLGFVTDGAYPEEHVVVAEFPATALAKELELIAQAREQVENEISSLSRENTFDADEWIVQAKQLHADIERSRVTAREIVEQHGQTHSLRSKVEDASAKVELIETEIAFNKAVADTLDEVQRLCQKLENARVSLANGDITAAIEQLEAIQAALLDNTFFTNTNVMSILTIEESHLRQEIEEAVCLRWSQQINVDRQKGELRIEKAKGTDFLESTIAALERLGILTAVNEKFQQDLITVIINPILQPRRDGTSHAVSVMDTGIHVESESSQADVAETIDRITRVLGYLRQNLSPSISNSLSQNFIPIVASKTISGWLSTSIPTDLGGLDRFESTLDLVLELAKTIGSWGWSGHEELTGWVNQAARLWLARRRVDSLDRVRRVLAASTGSTKQVERVEKETVTQDNQGLLENATSDDWDAEWDEDKDEPATATNDAHPEEDEEDVSAWGLDDDAQDDTKPQAATPPNDDDDDDAAADDDDAWGWGDEEEDAKDEKEPPKTARPSKPVNGKSTAQPITEKEVVLREVYTVTDIPESVLKIVKQQITDSRDISQPPHSNSRVASSGPGLLALPTLVLAMFKATSSSFYALKLNSGQMYLYNDSLYLAGQVRELMKEFDLSRLGSDVESLEKFGKFAYSKEMQTQSTIVTDLLDGAQGFGQCSEQPYRSECQNAVSAAVDRIRDVCKEWQPILSHSALLQSVGSLLSTMISKVIIDVEDLGDISEDQSKQLVNFCNQISKLEDIFTPETTSDVDAVPVTAVYVPNWLRFQYLVNILESSLADIKFLWLEGELGLEFSIEEVVDLIEALFAESDYRRRAIAEIRRAPRG